MRERENLFRAKTTKKSGTGYTEFDEIWVYGDLIHSGGKYYIHPVGNRVKVVNDLGRIIAMHEVQPETICRNTGLKDSHKNTIWEKDILSPGKNLVVIWNEKFASWCLSKKGWLYCHFFGEAIDASDTEVLGNAIDNPELLDE